MGKWKKWKREFREIAIIVLAWLFALSMLYALTWKVKILLNF